MYTLNECTPLSVSIFNTYFKYAKQCYCYWIGYKIMQDIFSLKNVITMKVFVIVWLYLTFHQNLTYEYFTFFTFDVACNYIQIIRMALITYNNNLTIAIWLENRKSKILYTSVVLLFFRICIFQTKQQCFVLFTGPMVSGN